MAKNLGFRSWYYFRTGWSTYFAFIFAAINTLTVTYFLAIENYPVLKEVFPTFTIYIIIIVGIGIPMLTLVGYFHFKRTPSYRAEATVMYETNPFARRMFVNSELNLQINQKLIDLILLISKNEKMSDDDISRVYEIQEKLNKFTDERTLSNKKDLDFMNKMNEY
tara:strand:- start:215 stop:709 length:495 start_codon:yes stop_codon:yes gene_type:complete